MKLKHFNLFLVIIVIILAINLFYPLKNIFDTINYNELSCSINGNEVNDAHLCCSEMAKFSGCKDGICKNNGYNILSDENMLKYCEKRGYNVRF